MSPENLPNNSEIDKALKEFEMSDLALPQAPVTMPGAAPREAPKMVRLVMKLGIKDQKQAEYVLLGFAILAILLSLYLFLGIKPKQTKIPSDALEKMKVINQNE